MLFLLRSGPGTAQHIDVSLKHGLNAGTSFRQVESDNPRRLYDRHTEPVVVQRKIMITTPTSAAALLTTKERHW